MRPAISRRLRLVSAQRSDAEVDRSLLALARFDAGQEVLKRLRFTLPYIADCAELVQPLADERGVKVIFEVPPLELVGDPERLAQVITNLLTNAIQYTIPKARSGCAFSPRWPRGADRRGPGQGIRPKICLRGWRFYRADKSRTGAGNAGLARHFKSIIEAHAAHRSASEEHTGTPSQFAADQSKIMSVCWGWKMSFEIAEW